MASAERPTTPKYGWRPDLPDQRDHVYAAPLRQLGPLPPHVDLRADCPAIYNQGNLGSCTANAIAGAVEYMQKKQHLTPFLPSRLFVYYNERLLEGTVNEDAGAMIRDGIKSVVTQGVCPETLWPYEVDKYRTKPSQSCYRTALLYRALHYQRVVRSLSQIQGCLAAGHPMVFGFTVYESFEGDQVAHSGHLAMPGHREQPLGGHAVLCVGYDNSNATFLVRNSWGLTWGLHGYFTMPYAYLLDENLSDDFWTITQVETGA